MNGAMRRNDGAGRGDGRIRGILLALCLGLALSSCASWRAVGRYDGWTLYGEPGREVDPQRFAAAIGPAMSAVEEILGPFEKTVRVHVWSGEAGPETSGADIILEGEGGPVQDVPGIGPARVRAYHARGEGLFGPPAGIFLAAPECGTAAHELVHARAAEENRDLPLWLEEGVACLLGDGFLDGERWVVDGLSCWPLRELQAQSMSDADLSRILSLGSSDHSSARENVLAHFVGWAIAFDLYREDGRVDWHGWCDRFGQGITLEEARRRISHTLDPASALAWMERLRDPRREVRLATAKGVWKLRSKPVATALLDAIEAEEDPEVRLGFAINLLACAGEVRLPDFLTGRLWRAVWPALRRAELADPEEKQAARDLLRSFRFRSGRSGQEPLFALRRFWAE
jgi:hypothetical protein